MSAKEIWTSLHGMAAGGGLLLLFSAVFFMLRSLRPNFLSETGVRLQIRGLAVIAWTMSALAWLAVILGTYVSYPWYRAPLAGKSPASVPKWLLLASPRTANWHNFGMEWKEHIAWLVPILLTAAAFIISVHGMLLITDLRLRRVLLFFYAVAFFAASVAGTLGGLINKAAPFR